jgi:hypothetical protein
MNYRRLYSQPKDIANGIIYDQIIMLNNHFSSKYYPRKMRSIKFKDEPTGKIFIFLTNNFHIKATEIAQRISTVGKSNYSLNGSNNILR